MPRWVEYGAFLLSVLAGSVNAVGLLGFQHQSVSHLSGTATLLGLELIKFSESSIHLLLILISFMVGSVISGYLIENTSLKLGRHYYGALLVEGFFLFIAMIFLENGFRYGHYLASAACGIQNALITTYSGAIIRTTHVTGIFTDLGLMIGSRLKGNKFDRRKSILYLLIISGFILGGSIGGFFYKFYQFKSLIFPIVLSIFLALVYRLYLLNKAYLKKPNDN
jgi:uncharacterized membrane protein YoaK (UPF0700 family)